MSGTDQSDDKNKGLSTNSADTTESVALQWRTETARRMVELGWLEDGPKLWRDEDGVCTFSAAEEGFCGFTRIDLGHGIFLDIDRWDLSRILGFTLVPERGAEISPAQRDLIRMFAGDELSDFVEFGGEGIFRGTISPLPVSIRRVAVAELLGNKFHPLWNAEAALAAVSDPVLNALAKQRATVAAPFLEALFHSVSAAYRSARLLASAELDLLFELISLFGGALNNSGVATSKELADFANTFTTVELANFDNDATGLERIESKFEDDHDSPTIVGSERTSDNDEGIQISIEEFDWVDVDEFKEATYRIIGGRVVVNVDVVEQDLPMWAQCVTASGTADAKQLVFGDSSTLGTAELVRPAEEFWVEIHPDDQPATVHRADRARKTAIDLASSVVARIQHDPKALVARQTKIDIERLIDLFDNSAFDIHATQQALELKRRLQQGSLGEETEVLGWPQLGVRRLIAAAQPIVQLLLDTDSLSLVDAQLLRGLAPTHGLVPVDRSEAWWPDFVPFEWLVDSELEKLLIEDQLPRGALAESVRSGSEREYRVELGESASVAGGISSIVIELDDGQFKVTCNLARPGVAPKISLAVTRDGSIVVLTKKSSNFADVYSAPWEGGLGSLRIVLSSDEHH